MFLDDFRLIRSKSFFCGNLITLLYLLMFFTMAYVGYKLFGRIDTESYTEGKMLLHAKGLLTGEKSWIAYDTNPFGASFIMVPFVQFGIDSIGKLRWFPHLIFCAAVVLVTMALVKDIQSIKAKLFFIALTFVVFFQPDFLLWSGGLHNQSYQTTLSVICAFFCFRKKSIWKISFLISFLQMFISYHFLPAFLGLCAICRLIYYCGERGFSGREAVFAVIRDISIFLFGMTAAFSINFAFGAIQLGGVDAVVRDWFGRLMVRADLGGQSLVPYYYDYIESNLATTVVPARLQIFFEYFLHLFSKYNIFTNTILFCALISLLLKHQKISTVRTHLFVVLSVATFLFSMLGASLWGLVLPKHFIIHKWFLLRDVLILDLALLFMCFQIFYSLQSKPDTN